MPLVVSPSESDINTAINTVLEGIVPSGVGVYLGQVNRVPEPTEDSYVIFWPISRPRIETNVDGFADAVFSGSITGTTLIIDAVQSGRIDVGSPVFGVGVTQGTVVTARGSGTGGVGTYVVNNSQTVSETTISAGTKVAAEQIDAHYQIDCHGRQGSTTAQIVMTLFRDAYGVDLFTALNPAITPLHADDPKQTPFFGGEQQYSDRWTVDAHLQVAASVSMIPQQFFDTAEVEIISVDAEYPPT